MRVLIQFRAFRLCHKGFFLGGIQDQESKDVRKCFLLRIVPCMVFVWPNG